MADKDALFDIPIDITFSGDKGDKGDSAYKIWLSEGNKGTKKDFLDSLKGEDGDSVTGDDGKSAYELWLEGGNKGSKKAFVESLKGEPGEPGKSGVTKVITKEIQVKPLQADKGDDGLSAYEIWLQNGNEGDEGEFLESLKGKDVKKTQWHGNAYTELREMEDVALSPQLVKGNLIAFNGTKWVEVPPAPSLDHYLAPNPLTDSGLAWQERGFSYLTDEAGNILTDEAGNALEGKDTIDALLLVNDKSTLLEVTFADSPVTLTRPDNGKTTIDVDCTGGVVIINLYPLAKFDEIEIKKTDVSGNKLTYKGNGDDTVDDLAERDISTQYNNDRLIGATLQWRRR